MGVTDLNILACYILVCNRSDKGHLLLAIVYALTVSENPVCGALVSISPLDLALTEHSINYRNKPGSLAELFKVAHSLTSQNLWQLCSMEPPCMWTRLLQMVTWQPWWAPGHQAKAWLSQSGSFLSFSSSSVPNTPKPLLCFSFPQYPLDSSQLQFVL